jgi:hypothetical protein
VIALERDGTVAIVDPAHGGEVLELIAPGGARPLGRSPFGPRPPRAGELDADSWEDRYRGGWQLVAPNTGNASVVDGVEHGFHGGASTARWSVEARSASSAELACEHGGLRFERRLELRDGRLRAETRVHALAGPRPLVALEHVACGASVLAPGFTLSVPAGRAYEVDLRLGPTSTPDAAPAFPGVLLLDGTTEDASSWPIGRPRSREYVVADVPEGVAEVRNAETGEGLRLRWDVGVLPHLWIWHEARASGGRWRGAAELLGIEPSIAPHQLGLAEAIASGHARTVERASPLAWWIELEPLEATIAS